LHTFDGVIAKSFVLSKPKKPEQYHESELPELEKQKRLIITRKRDGYKMFASVDERGVIRLYTDGINEIDNRLWHIKEELAFLKLPKNSLLVGEAIVDNNGSDEFTHVASVFKSSEKNSLVIQNQKSIGHIRFMVFNIIFFDGEPVTLPYSDVLKLIDTLIPETAVHTFRVPILKMSLEKAKALVEKGGWEGLVLYAKDYVISYRMDGKDPQRTKGCYKWKPIKEDDFIVRSRIIRPGTEIVKEIILLQIDPDSGEEFDCGKLGGFTKKMREFLADNSIYPLVVQVEFELRFRSGKLRNARFARIRTDKRAEDCIAPYSFNSG